MKMQQTSQQTSQQTMNSATQATLSHVPTEQIQKCLDENKNLILAILEGQKMGKVAECAQFQAILQKNLMNLAAIADAQPQASPMPLQPAASSVAPQGTSHMSHSQASTMQQQTVAPVPKSPFQPNALRSHDQPNQLLRFQQQQQQLQGHFSVGGAGSNGLLPSVQPGLGNSMTLMDMRGIQPGALEAGSGNGHGHSASTPVEG